MDDVVVRVDLDALRAAVDGLRWARARWDAFDRLDGLDRGVLLHDELYRAFGHFAKDWDDKRHKVRALVDEAASGLDDALQYYAEMERAMANAYDGNC